MFRFLWEAARPFLDLAKSMLPTVKLLAQILGVGLAGGMLVARVAAVAFRNVVEALTNGLLALWNAAVAAARALKGDFSGAWDAAKEAGSFLGQSIIDLGEVVDESVTEAIATVEDFKATLDALGNVDLSGVRTEVNGLAVGCSLAGVSAGDFGGDGDGSGGGGGGGGGISDAQKSMGAIFDLTRRWFDLRSQLEKGLLGSAGFEATIDQIASMGQKLVEAMSEIGRPGSSLSSNAARDLFGWRTAATNSQTGSKRQSKSWLTLSGRGTRLHRRSARVPSTSPTPYRWRQRRSAGSCWSPSVGSSSRRRRNGRRTLPKRSAVESNH